MPGVGVASIPARTWRYSEAADIANRQLCSDVCISSHAGAEKRYPTSMAAISGQASGAASGACGAPKLVIVTGSVESSTSAEICTSSGTTERVIRKRRTVDLGETKAGSWGCVD